MTVFLTGRQTWYFTIIGCEQEYAKLILFVLFPLLVTCLAGEDDSLALKKKVTVEDLFGQDLHIHDPDAKWLSGKRETIFPWLLA